MQPEEKEMLKKTLELVKENNDMLYALKHSIFWGRIFRFIYWIVILGAAVGVYYYIEPYLDSAADAYVNVKRDLKSFSDLFKQN